MLGAFHVMLAQEGVFWEACKSIWLHGTLEILTFIVEFAAGLVVGYSILFPKTYSRLESFKRGAKDGLKIIIGCLPITIFSAAVESYFTRHVPDVHPAISISFISLSLVFMIWYFVIYPIRVEKKLAYAGENH
nr:stage II sporulation protein M [Saprospiraceae bacterium]